MLRLTISDGDALVSTNADESAKAAAIAAMGQRLAAAGLRTRQCLIDLQVAPVYADRVRSIDGTRAVERGDVVAACDPEEDWDDIPWREYLGALRRFAILGSAAACGFGLVLAGESLPKLKTHHAPRSSAGAMQEAALQTAAPAALPAGPAAPQPKQPEAQQQSPPPQAAAPPKSANPSEKQPQIGKPILLAALPGAGTGAATVPLPDAVHADSAKADPADTVHANAPVPEAAAAPVHGEAAAPTAMMSTPVPVPHPQLPPVLPAPRVPAAPEPSVAETNTVHAAPAYKAQEAPRPVHTETITASSPKNTPVLEARSPLRVPAPPAPRLATASAPRIANANPAEEGPAHRLSAASRPPAHIRTATAVMSAPAPLAHPQIRRLVIPATHMVAVHARPKPHVTHDMNVARFELPRWLTEGQPVRPRILAMSEQPHDLKLPPSPPLRALPALRPPLPASAHATLATPPSREEAERAEIVASSDDVRPRPSPYYRPNNGYAYGTAYNTPYNPYYASQNGGYYDRGPPGGYYYGGYGGGGPYGPPSGEADPNE